MTMQICLFSICWMVLFGQLIASGALHKLFFGLILKLFSLLFSVPITIGGIHKLLTSSSRLKKFWPTRDLFCMTEPIEHSLNQKFCLSNKCCATENIMSCNLSLYNSFKAIISDFADGLWHLIKLPWKTFILQGDLSKIQNRRLDINKYQTYVRAFTHTPDVSCTSGTNVIFHNLLVYILHQEKFKFLKCQYHTCYNAYKMLV